MANVDVDKLKELLMAVIETLDSAEEKPAKQKTQKIRSKPKQRPTSKKSPENKTIRNKTSSKRDLGGTNLFLAMPEMNMHKSDVAIDKLLAPEHITDRNRSSSLVNVVCRICGKKEKVSSKLIIDGVSRYKCNDCSARSSG